MGPTWVLSAPDGPHDGPMNFAVRAVYDDNHSTCNKADLLIANFTIGNNIQPKYRQTITVREIHVWDMTAIG